MKIVITFAVLSLINVIFSVVREIITVKGSKSTAAIINAGYFSFYNIMIIYTVADFPLLVKCTITFICNLIGVYIVKLLEERRTKDKLWKVEFSLPEHMFTTITKKLQDENIGYSFMEYQIYNGRYCEYEKWYTIYCYCDCQHDSEKVAEILKKYPTCKYFVTEQGGALY